MNIFTCPPPWPLYKGNKLKHEAAFYLVNGQKELARNLGSVPSLRRTVADTLSATHMGRQREIRRALEGERRGSRKKERKGERQTDK